MTDSIHAKSTGTGAVRHVWHPDRARQFLLATCPGGAIPWLPVAGGSVELLARIALLLLLSGIFLFFGVAALALLFCI